LPSRHAISHGLYAYQTISSRRRARLRREGCYRLGGEEGLTGFRPLAAGRLDRVGARGASEPEMW
jgi:hypothetical protein